jgi:hypothetical protein
MMGRGGRIDEMLPFLSITHRKDSVDLTGQIHQIAFAKLTHIIVEILNHRIFGHMRLPQP